jgi:hypothetical protein
VSESSRNPRISRRERERVKGQLGFYIYKYTSFEEDGNGFRESSRRWKNPLKMAVLSGVERWLVGVTG